MNPYSFDYTSQQEGARRVGEYLSYLYKTNPVFILQDQVFGWWFDQFVLGSIKAYYWPAFVAGTADNVVDLFKPQTYSICRPR